MIVQRFKSRNTESSRAVVLATGVFQGSRVHKVMVAIHEDAMQYTACRYVQFFRVCAADMLCETVVASAYGVSARVVARYPGPKDRHRMTYNVVCVSRCPHNLQ